jgi:GntP family gluconate:H+ symporter
MIEFLTQNIAPIMFVGLVIFLLFGYPVAFALGACGLVFGLIGIELGLMPASLFQALPLRLFGIMSNDTLLAIPFFTSEAAWPRTCSTPSGSCSAPFGAALPTR